MNRMEKQMNRIFNYFTALIFISILTAAQAFAGNNMSGHDMANKDRIGDLIHESVVDGYMLSYYFMDLRDKGDDKKSEHDMEGHDMAGHDMGKKEMDKPHHLMLYIMDMNHKPVLKGKVGFLIRHVKSDVSQKAMGMFMSQGFGITADMKEKGAYKITAKAVLDGKKIMDKFEYTN